MLDRLLTGDWGGAAVTAATAVGVMLALSLVGMLLLTGADAGVRETLSLVTGTTAAAVGGNVYGGYGGSGFEDAVDSTFGILPLTVTLAGLGTLAGLFLRRLGRRAATTGTEVGLQAVRTGLVFTACFLVLSLLSRYKLDEDEGFGSARAGVGVASTLFGALLFAAATLGLCWLLSRRYQPTKVGRYLAPFRPALAGATAVFSAGLVAVLAGLVYTLVKADEKVAQLGVAVLGAVNGAFASVLLSAGVPLGVEGSAGAELAAELDSASDSVDLLTFTDESAWYWFAPVVLLLVLLAVATALVLRQNSIEDARREGFRFAAALALVAFVAALLLRISGEGEVSVLGGGVGDGAVEFNPVVAAFALGVWGAVAGLVAPVLAAKTSPGLVAAVRRRFGSAPVTTPGPPPTAVYGQPAYGQPHQHGAPLSPHASGPVAERQTDVVPQHRPGGPAGD